MEKLVLAKLNNYLEHNDLLEHSYYELRKSRSCPDRLPTLSTKLHTALETNLYTARLLLDINRTLNNVVPKILVYDMLQLGIRNKICKFIHNLTKNK